MPPTSTAPSQFPSKVARFVSTSAETHYAAWKEGKPANIARAVLVVTKIDILPSSIDPDQLGSWVRQRAHFGGAGPLVGVHLVSAVRGWGVRDLVEHVRQLVGVRGNVWAVGAQNARKSTLLNAMAKCVGEKLSCLTEAPVPGTTLGIVRVEGVLGGQAKLFDMPGILHPYQIGMRLTAEEQKEVHMSKELRPRTYLIKDIIMYVNSPGGSVTAGMAIFDIMRHIRPDVSTVCVGLAASMGAFILSSGTKGKRYSLPNSRIMIHQPLGGAQGGQTDIDIQANEMLHHKANLNGYLAYHTGQSLEKINQDTDRDFFMSAKEAKEYGLIDGVILNPLKALQPLPAPEE